MTKRGSSVARMVRHLVVGLLMTMGLLHSASGQIGTTIALVRAIQRACVVVPDALRRPCANTGFVLTGAQCLASSCCSDTTRPIFGGCFRITPTIMGGFCSFIAPAVRVECGQPGITNEQCRSQRCCFDGTTQNNIQCFRPRIRAECVAGSLATASRQDCGFPGIGRVDCTDRGCCFDSTTVGTIFCFQPLPRPLNSAANCAAGRQPRRDCGFAGISQHQCLQRRCCFDPNMPGSNFCFQPVQAQVPQGGGAAVPSTCRSSFVRFVALCETARPSTFECARMGCCLNAGRCLRPQFIAVTPRIPTFDRGICRSSFVRFVAVCNSARPSTFQCARIGCCLNGGRCLRPRFTG